MYEPLRRLSPCDRIVTLWPRRAYEASYVPVRGVTGFAFDSQSGTHAFASDRKVPFRSCPNTLSWVPANCDVWSTSDAGGEYLTIETATDPVRQTTKIARTPNFIFQRRFNERQVPAATEAAHTIRAVLLRGVPDLDALSSAIDIIESVVDDVLDDSIGSPSAGRWLTSRRIRAIDEYIDTHLSERPSVADLAHACDVSPGFLSRVMKAASGRSPHDYAVDRRLIRAREQLVGTSANVSTIALDCGFASHAHLTATMRRRLGITPTNLRNLSARRPQVQGHQCRPSNGYLRSDVKHSSA